MILSHKHIPTAMLLEDNLEEFKTFMNIEITKPNKNKWKFPCKGISKTDGTIVGFSSYGIGTVLDTGQSTSYRLYSKEDGWNMDNFQPIEEEKQPTENIESTEEVDWDQVTFPIWAKNIDGLVFLIYAIKERRVSYFTIYGNYTRFTNEKVFYFISDRNEWLNSLEVLPNGTKIEITI